VDLLASATIGDEDLFRDVRYSIDGYSRRLCGTAQESTRHALFFGGSYAFGEGLANDQTLACRFQALSLERYQASTYAMMGWGASQTLVQLGVDVLFSDVEHPSGIAVYSFINDHIFRTTWKVTAAADFPLYPFFGLTDTGSLDGPFTASDKWNLKLARDVFSFSRSFSPTFRTLVGPSWFRLASDLEATITTARVLGAARRRYVERFDGEFVVVLWPRFRLETDLETRFVEELTLQNIIVVRIPELPGDPLEAQIHPLDPHPSAAEVAWVAKNLNDALIERGL
jgi:hypothetical protein